jgi:hypothetical protein
MHSASAWSAPGGLQRLDGGALHDRHVVAVEPVLAQQVTQLHLDQLDHLGPVRAVRQHVDLVEEHHHRRDAHLAPEQDVLARLRHRTVRRAHHEDRAVHLRRSRDHVLDVVGVAGAVDVRVVPLLRVVLHVRRADRDAAGPLFRRLVDLVVSLELRHALQAEHASDRRGQRRLSMVDVTDGADVDVGLVTE